MAVDPSIPLQTGPSIPQIAQDWMGLSQMSNVLQTQRWQMETAMEDKRKRAAILDLYKRPDTFDENGVISLNAIKQMATIDPEIAGQAATNRVGMMNQMEMMQKRRTEEMKAKQSVGIDFLKQYSTFHETAKQRGMGDQQANEYAKAETMRAMEESEKAGLQPGFTSNDWRGLHMLVGNLTPDRAEATVKASIASKEFTDIESTRRAERRVKEIEEGKAPEQPAPAEGVPLSEVGAQPRMVAVGEGQVVPQTIDPQTGAVVRGFVPPGGRPYQPPAVTAPATQAAPKTVAAPPSEEQQIQNEITSLQNRQKVYRQEGMAKRANELDAQIEKRRGDLDKARRSRLAETREARLATITAREREIMGAPEALTPGGIQVAKELVAAGIPLPGGYNKVGQSRGNRILNLMAEEEAGGPGSGAVVRGIQTAKAQAAAVKDVMSGQTGRNIVALNTAIGHMGTVNELADLLESKDTKRVNQFINLVRKETGDPRVNNLELARNALGDELMRVFRQVGASENESAMWRRSFDAAASPAQMKGAVRVAGDLLYSRLNAQNEAYKARMGTKEDMPGLLSDHSKQVLKELGVVNPQERKSRFGITKPGMTVAPFADRDKERRYQEWKLQHGQ